MDGEIRVRIDELFRSFSFVLGSNSLGTTAFSVPVLGTLIIAIIRVKYCNSVVSGRRVYYPFRAITLNGNRIKRSRSVN